MSGLLSGVVGAFVEAWSELRVNKLRVLLSLVGVAVAVAALTAVVGLGSLAEQSTRESSEKSGGRPATYTVSAYTTGAGVLDPALVDREFRSTMSRYDVTWASEALYTTRSVQLPGGLTDVSAQIVDPEYGEMHRVALAEGSWFVDGDERRMAPAVVVNEALWEQLGRPPVSSHPTLQLRGADSATGVVVGVTAALYEGEGPAIFLLPSDELDLVPVSQGGYPESPQYEMWLPPGSGDELSAMVQGNLAAALGDDVQVDVSRTDYAAYAGDTDPFLPIKLTITGVGVLVLLLGGLGLVNIALVTVRQRIREIGVRRSFGATAPRVFFSVMLESVAGTVVAGVVGVMVAVLVVQNGTVQGFIAQGAVDDLPPFPITAALVGLGSATLIGAVAGLLPALVAVRVKVIDAIRY
ncbi:ABC transporter permease [Frigoribacterium sp. CFBP 8754]|uniref:ABC transporter permease n=1 Tax=Frigoribacterium sp. CFBP 8754 TaxID=2775290 RepID=UPI00177B026F|nr:ABC transporter permease [Frigoribacterium sp. CFBP 8754]